MKRALIALSFLVASPAFAGGAFTCYSVDNNSPYALKSFSVDLSKSKAKITWHIGGETTTESASVDTSFDPKPTSSVAAYERFNITTSNTRYPDTAISEVYFEGKLVDGGYRLNDGSTGGFAKILGWGYSYAKYICKR